MGTDTPARVAICVVGYQEIGLGHVQNQLQVAAWYRRTSGTEVHFCVDEVSDLARQRLLDAPGGHAVHAVPRRGTPAYAAAVAELHPHVIVNDVLNTPAGYVDQLRAACVALGNTTVRIVNFEDLGQGRWGADAVVNAIYEEGAGEGAGDNPPAADTTAATTATRNCVHYYGERYFIAKDDFLEGEGQGGASAGGGDGVRSVLLTFGGVDPSDLTLNVLRAIHAGCEARGVTVTVILGPGYPHPERVPAEFPGVRVLRNVVRMSDVMRGADVAFASCGRTPFELATLGVPTVTLAQNPRELTHFFATARYGFVALGLGADVPPAAITAAFETMCDDPAARAAARARLLSHDVIGGRDRVGGILDELLAAARARGRAS